MLEVDEDSRLGLEILATGSRYGAGERPTDELTVELYERAVDRLAAMGVHRYEISNFARAGHESRHNLKYWRLEPYVGFGADAHSFDGRMRRQNAEQAESYVEAIERGEPACVAETAANARRRAILRGAAVDGGHSSPGGGVVATRRGRSSGSWRQACSSEAGKAPADAPGSVVVERSVSGVREP